MPVELDELAGPFGRDEGRRLADFWRSQLGKVRDDSLHKRWIKRGESIEKRYRDERNRTDEEGQRRYNSLWSNVEILYPALYGKCPVPIAERRFKDKDVVGRGAAQILERALRNEIEINNFNEAVGQAVQDYLLPGLGAVWVRYEPEIEDGVSVVTEGGMDIEDTQGDIEPYSEDEETQKLRNTGDRIIRESVPIDYINWRDFITFPNNARTWKEVTAVCKRVYMTRDQMISRFGKTVGKDIPLRKDDRNFSAYHSPDQDPSDKGEIYEIWSLVDKSVYWVAEGYEYLCDRKDDPLQLEGFFPCPRPLFANATTGTLIPVPDFIEYQDQAIQIDELTQRIAMLSKACKVAGVYNSAAKDIQRVMNESVENELIPVDDWAAFAEQGGVAGNISLLPLKEIIGVLNELMMIKDKCIQEMDRLTGITDIMRGTTDARETLGGQRLKTNSSGTRLQRRQNEVARFARDVVRIMADIMAQHFSPQSLIEASGAMYEEGLGDIDVSMLPMQATPPPAPSPMGALPPPGNPMAPGPAAAPPPAAGPPNNVVPLRPNMPVPRPPMPGMMMPPPPPPEVQAQLLALKRISDAIGLIRNEKLRGFRVDIEVDSTIFGDMQQEKGDRTQFIAAVTQFLEQSMAMSAQIPEITPLLGKLMQFGVRGFRVGRDLESAIEDFCDEAVLLAKKKAQQAAAQPNPEQIKAQAAMVKAQSGARASDAKTQMDALQTRMDAQESQAKISADAGKAQAEIVRQHLENQGEQANSQADIFMKQMDMQMRQLELQIERMRMEFEQQKIEGEQRLMGQKIENDQEMMDQKIEHQKKMNKIQAQKAKNQGEGE